MSWTGWSKWSVTGGLNVRAPNRMSAALEWLNGFSAQWWACILQASWQTAVVALFLLAAVHVLGRRWPAPLRYALLLLALLKFACPPFLSAPTGLFTGLVQARPVFAAPSERKPTTASAPMPAITASTRGSVLGQLGKVRWTVWLMLLHATGSGVMAWLLLREAARWRALVRASSQLLGGDLYRDVSLQLGLYRIPPLVASERAEGPLALGFTRPTIVLPAKLLGRLSPDELRAVLAHELAHCKRGDLWVNWVQLALLALWWFHPVLWVLNRSIRDVREDCCDDLLLAEKVVANDAYCDVLLRAAAQLTGTRQVHAAVGFGEQVHCLARRLQRITDWTLHRADDLSRAGAIMVLILAALLLPGVRTREVAEVSGERPTPTSGCAAEITVSDRSFERQTVLPEGPGQAWNMQPVPPEIFTRGNCTTNPMTLVADRPAPSAANPLQDTPAVCSWSELGRRAARLRLGSTSTAPNSPSRKQQAVTRYAQALTAQSQASGWAIAILPPPLPGQIIGETERRQRRVIRVMGGL
jgi:beta-lactamase regulating signal transducer with metallopeptidase domain